MNMKKKLGGSVLLAAVVLLGSTPSFAYGPEGLFGGRPSPDSALVLGNPVELKNDRPERAESVLEHPRPDYDAVPIDIGSFEMFPTLELGATYDSNIYATPNGERDDAVGTIRPIVNLFSNWGRHALAVTVFGDSNYYSQHADENYNNALVDLNGRYDISNQTWLSGRTGYQRLAETRTSPLAVNGSEPTTFGVGKAGLTAYRGVGKLKASVDYDYKRFDYDDTKADNGAVIDQTQRDRDEHVMGGKLAYEISPNMKPYLRGDYNIRSYNHNATHDSDGFETLVGVEADFGGITSLDVFAGWMTQYYDDFAVKKTLSTPRVGGRLEWNVTGLTSVVFEADRTIEEASSMDAYSSYYQTGGSATITHELLRNVLLEGNTTYSHSDFNGTADREDDSVSAGLGGRYLINRNLYTDLLYNWERRYSTEDTSEYTRNMVTLRLGVRL
ncbi:MAG: outer membrane beta-barrel protein [Alphaproteobacteria bacterium]|nr:outer membrane beta-barrel protein [Alphaproteobacteria bacterium]